MANEELYRYFRERGLADWVIDAFSITYDAGRHAARIPYFDAKGREEWFRWRSLAATGWRWDSPKGMKAHLFNVTESQAPIVYLCEGETDTISLWQFFKSSPRKSSIGVVGIPGVMNFKEPWKWLFTGSNVRIVMDPDEEGMKAAHRLRRLLASVCDPTVIALPSGQDVNNLLRAGTLAEYIN